jgi:hypothetical protein
MIRTAAAVGSAAVALLLAAPVAQADNQSFLGAVGDLSALVGSDAGLLKVGKGSCHLLGPNEITMFGIIPDRVADMVWEKNPMLERPQAVRIVNAAKDNLCPGTGMFGYAT